MHPPTSSQVILLTGASGLIGGDALRWLELALEPSDTVVALTHTSHGLPSSSSLRLEVVRGDLTEPGLGLTYADYRDLQRQVTGILHCAATTRLSVDLHEAERTNVRGTGHLIELARGAPRLSRFAHVSTAYVAGRRTGSIREAELEHTCGFVNAYEWSKYEAERLVRASDIPWSVYRLSPVIGSAATGEVRAYNGVHQAIRFLACGIVTALPGCPDTLVDFISDEFAAAALHHLFVHFAPGSTYHVCAGAGKTLPLTQALDDIFGTLSRIQRRSVKPPLLVDEPSFERLRRCARSAAEPRASRAWEAMACYTPQLLFPKVFDCSQTEAVLAPAGIEPPPLGDFLARIFERCARSSWGRRANVRDAAVAIA